MQENNWPSLMAAYHSKNFSVIPLNDKRISMVKEWSRFNVEPPDDSLYLKGQRGVGLCVGKASGVMAIDIDTTDLELIKVLKNILPTTPVQRFGSKGIGLVYSLNHKLTSRKFRHIQVELFADSGYIALPPSHHEKTGTAYKWTGSADLLSIDKDDLPSFGEREVAELERLDEQYGRANPKETHQGVIGKGGRHDALLAQAFAGLHAGKTVDTIADELKRFDLTKHNPPWFVEERGAKSESETFTKAREFVMSANKTFEKKNGPKETREEKLIFNFKPMPAPDGFMGDVINFLNKVSLEESVESAFAGAIAMMSYLCACRFTCGGQFSNVCVINLAETGSGKSFAMKRIVNILDSAMKDSFFMRNEYRSEPSVWNDLIDNKETFDVLDEVSTLFKKTADKNTSFGELLMKLWDASDSKWKTPSYSKSNKDAQNHPKYIRNPSITIWGASTIKTFESVIDVTTYENGLLPRALLLIKEGHGEVNENYIETDMVKQIADVLRDSVRSFVEQHKIKFVPDLLKLNGEKEIETKEIMVGALNRIQHAKDVEMRKRMHKTEEPALKGFMSRYPQHIRKLSMLHAVSRNFNASDISVEQQDLDWADAFIEVLIHNNSLFFSRTATATEAEKKTERTYAFIAQTNGGVTRSQLLRKLKYQGKVLTQVLQDLKDASLIDSVIVPGSEKKRGVSAEKFFAVKQVEN